MRGRQAHAAPCASLTQPRWEGAQDDQRLCNCSWNQGRKRGAEVLLFRSFELKHAAQIDGHMISLQLLRDLEVAVAPLAPFGHARAWLSLPPPPSGQVSQGEESRGRQGCNCLNLQWSWVLVRFSVLLCGLGGLKPLPVLGFKSAVQDACTHGVPLSASGPWNASPTASKFSPVHASPLFLGPLCALRILLMRWAFVHHAHCFCRRGGRLVRCSPTAWRSGRLH